MTNSMGHELMLCSNTTLRLVQQLRQCVWKAVKSRHQGRHYGNASSSTGDPFMGSRHRKRDRQPSCEFCVGGEMPHLGSRLYTIVLSLHFDVVPISHPSVPWLYVWNGVFAVLLNAKSESPIINRALHTRYTSVKPTSLIHSVSESWLVLHC